MRSTLFLHTLVLLSLLAPTMAADTQRLFTALDQNQDGWLLASEINQQHERLFERLLRTADSDQDGRLSSGEFQAGLEPRQPTEPLARKQGSELPGANAMLLLLAKMDTNSDGRIEADEVPQQFRQIFDRIEDRVGGEPDGLLDRRELTQAGPLLSQIGLRIAERMDLDVDVELALLSEQQWRSVQQMASPRSRGELLADPRRARQVFRQLDANGDGHITIAEVPEQFAALFEQLIERADRDQNDQISEQELMTFSRNRQAFAAKRLTPAQLQEGIERFINRLDQSGDGRISRQEAPRSLALRFERVDRDGSGQLDRDELAPVVELRSRLRRPETISGNETDAKMLPDE